MPKLLFVAALLAAAANPLRAQIPIPFSIQGGALAALPVGSLGDRLDPGTTLGIGGMLGLAPGLGLYATYSNTTFSIKESDDEVVDSGVSAGVTLAITPVRPHVMPFVSLGVVAHELEADEEEAVEIGESEIGVEVGAGLAIQVATHVRLSPTVGFRRYAVVAPGLLDPVEGHQAYLTFGAGLNIAV